MKNILQLLYHQVLHIPDARSSHKFSEDIKSFYNGCLRIDYSQNYKCMHTSGLQSFFSQFFELTMRTAYSKLKFVELIQTFKAYNM